QPVARTAARLRTPLTGPAAQPSPGRPRPARRTRMRTLLRRSRWRVTAGLVAAGALAASGLTAATAAAATSAPAAAAAAPAAAACQVAYSTPSDWGSGFTASITITNQGSPLTFGTLAYSYGGNQQLAQGWSGNSSQSGQNVTVTNAAWNGTLGTGATAQIGANFTYSGTNTAPTAFTLNRTP